MMMKKRRLEIALQKLGPLDKRDPRLEQYSTPAHIAADVLWEAYSSGDIEGRTVIDLGCGNGVLAIGAKMLGAKSVTAIDIDPEAVRTASENGKALEVNIEFKTLSVNEAAGTYDTVIENPPFGAQRRHADRDFVKKAIELAPRAYSLHNAETEGFVRKLAGSLGARTVPLKKYKFEIPYAFEFHRKATETISVVLLRFER